MKKITFAMFFWTSIVQAQTWGDGLSNILTYTSSDVSIGQNFLNGSARLNVFTGDRTFGLRIQNLSPNSVKYGLYAQTFKSLSQSTYGVFSTIPYAPLNTNERIYGLYSVVSGSTADVSGIKYGLYSECLGKQNFSAYFHGDVGFLNSDVDFSYNGSFNNTFTIHMGWQNADYSMYITPRDENGIFLFENSLVFQRNGNLQKKVPLTTSKAISVYNSSTQLDVFRVLGNGKVFATEVEVKAASSFPDFVFTNEYDLMTLDDLRTFIKINGHLPGISERECLTAEQGIDIGSLSLLSVQKIEELHLYILQLQDMINNQQKEIYELRKHIEN